MWFKRRELFQVIIDTPGSRKAKQQNAMVKIVVERTGVPDPRIISQSKFRFCSIVCDYLDNSGRKYEVVVVVWILWLLTSLA